MASPRPSPKTNKVRLQRFLASCGVGSRRACEALIDQGVVEVDGRTVSRQGLTVDPDAQEIKVRGRRVVPQPRVTIMMHKPRRVICTANDPQGRPTVYGLMPALGSRMYTIGRLDWDSEGLLLVTSDGDFCHTLSHPRHRIAKTYRVWLDQPLDVRQMDQCRAGVASEGDVLRVLAIRTLPPRRGPTPGYEIVLGEGRNRHIRRMMGAQDRRVLRLQRIAIGPLKLGRLQPGEWRALRAEEVEQLRAAAEGTRIPEPPAPPRAGGGRTLPH